MASLWPIIIDDEEIQVRKASGEDSTFFKLVRPESAKTSGKKTGKTS